MVAPEMNSVPTAKIFQPEWGNSNTLSIQLSQRAFQSPEIIWISQKNDICISAEFSGAVEDAGLAAYQKKTHVV
jgi:hypothetical protein